MPLLIVGSPLRTSQPLRSVSCRDGKQRLRPRGGGGEGLPIMTYGEAPPERGTVLASDLSWNGPGAHHGHINEAVKKASKCLYFLDQLKRAKLPCTTVLRPLLCHMYKINLSLCSACFLLCSAQVLTV